MRLSGFIILLLAALSGYSQTIVGIWQVTKESTCLEIELGSSSEAEEELTNEMAALSGQTPKVLQFNSDNSGEQNWKSAGRKKSAVRDKFLYKVADYTLYLLDKKSKLITDTYLIEVLTENNLVLVNKSRSCEQIELVRVKQP